MYRNKTNKQFNILLVEDNPGDVRLIVEAFKEGRFNINLHVAVDGVEALSFIRQKGETTKAVLPDIILLDLNLPKKDGFEVLQEIKANQDLKTIPVIIVTSSEDEQDIVKSYELQANCYITKPVELEQFITVIKSIMQFWLTIVKLPSNAFG